MSIEMPKEFFLDEVRDGFLIPGLTKKALAVSLNNYKTLEKYCRSRGISALVMFGSLIGAIRGGGFIPWDDDMDVMMLREDYLKLKELDATEGIPKGYTLVDFENHNMPNLVRNWIDSEASVRKPDEWKDFYGFPYSCCIDILLVEHVPDDPEEIEDYRMFLKFFWVVVETAKKLGNNPIEQLENPQEFLENIKRIEKLMDCHIDLDSRGTLVAQIMKQLDNFCEMYLNADFNNRAGAVYLSAKTRAAAPKELYEDYIEMPFENTTISVPIGYDGLLRRVYMNYIFPLFDASSHNYPYYGEMEKDIKNRYGVEMLHYRYDSEKVKQILNSKNKGPSISERLLEILDILIEGHRYIIESGLTDETRSLLGQCQEVAVSMGELAEEKAVSPDSFVRRLEQYCEDLYKISEGTELSTEDADALTAYEGKLKELISGLTPKREIVLLCYRAEHWKTLHTLWEAASADETVNVSVVPIPYYYKDYEGKIITDEPAREDWSFPDEVEVLDYTACDFENTHPDVIITQYPYDEFHVGMSVHPYFYMSNLVKYTDKLVLIPPFVTREVTKDDGRSRVSLRVFLHTPGVVFADEIIAQSENMKAVYAELCSELTEDIDWNNKIKGSGSPLQDWNSRSRVLIKPDNEAAYYTKSGNIVEPAIFDEIYEIPSEWMEKLRRPDGSLKKILLVSINGSIIFEHKMKEIKKIKDIISFVSKYSDDLILYWYQDPYTREILHKRAPKLWNAYKEITNKINTSPNSIADSSFDDDRAAAIADMAYADGCSVINQCRMRGKPGLMENPDITSPVNEGGERRKWSANLYVQYEMVWRLDNFIEEAMKFSLPRDESRVGEMIYSVI